MNTAKKITDILILQKKNNVIIFITFTAASSTSTIEIFDGEIGVVDATGDVSVSAAGTNYEVGDLLTITPTNGGTPAVFTVATIDTGGEVLTVTLTTPGSGFITGATHATTTDSTAGADCTLDTDTIDNAINATSKGKISCVANTSDAQSPDLLTVEGISVLMTGASAVGYLYHE